MVLTLVSVFFFFFFINSIFFHFKSGYIWHRGFIVVWCIFENEIKITLKRCWWHALNYRALLLWLNWDYWTLFFMLTGGGSNLELYFFLASAKIFMKINETYIFFNKKIALPDLHSVFFSKEFLQPWNLSFLVEKTKYFSVFLTKGERMINFFYQ